MFLVLLLTFTNYVFWLPSFAFGLRQHYFWFSACRFHACAKRIQSRERTMPTIYQFDLTSDDRTLKLRLTKDAFPDTWRDMTTSNSCLSATPSGNVDSSRGNKLICHTGPPNNEPAITLNDATWDSAVGDTGDATCDLCDIGCPTNWSWVLSSKR